MSSAWRGRRSDPDPPLYFGRCAAWYAREFLTLAILLGFVVVLVHLAGVVGVAVERRS